MFQSFCSSPSWKILKNLRNNNLEGNEMEGRLKAHKDLEK